MTDPKSGSKLIDMARFGTRALLAAVICAIASAQPSRAAAQEPPNRLETTRDVRRACRRAEEDGRRELNVVSFAGGGWSFGEYGGQDGFLPINTRQNLRAFRGSVELFPAGMEEVGFIVGAERANELQRRAGGLTLRIAFFLGFDNSRRTMCLVRSSASVTTVRMDVAYLELIGRGGRVVARQDTDRYRAWADDAEHDAIPGEGPRGAIGAATRGDGAGIAPEAWQQSIAAANLGSVARAIGRCHAAGISRGADDGSVVVRLEVDARTGHTGRAEVELSSIGDDEAAACIARALTHISFPPQPALGGRVILSLPVRVLR